MRVVIVEDNLIEASYIKSLLLQENDIEIIGEADNGIKALEVISRKIPDLVFLDISMPGLSGIDVASKISEDIKIIFITASADFAIDAFRVGSIDYILKPVSRERLIISLNRARKVQTKFITNTISINYRGKITFLDINKVLFIEKASGIRHIIIHTINDKYILAGTLKEHEERLKANGFMRTHKAYIVNLSKIKEIIPFGDKSYVAKLHGTTKEVHISRKYAPHIKFAFTT